MSIGLVIRYTYDETCELCEKVALFIKKIPSAFNKFFTRVGYARADFLNLQDRDTTKKQNTYVREG